MATDAINTTELSLLSQRIAELEHELGRLQDESQIRKLQYTYGYFIDKSQYNEVVDLFAEDGEVWFLGGIYKDKKGVRRLYIERFQTQFTQGHNGPRYGWLLDHPQLQMVIDVAPDRKTAKVRGRSTMQAGLHETAEGQQRVVVPDAPDGPTFARGASAITTWCAEDLHPSKAEARAGVGYYAPVLVESKVESRSRTR